MLAASEKCGVGADLSWVFYAEVNSSVLSLDLKVSKVPALRHDSF